MKEEQNKPIEEATLNGAFEIIKGVSVEEMRAIFFDKEALIEPSYKVWQLNSKGHRYYYRFEEDGVRFYPSVTTILSQTMPTPPYLVKWIADMGYDQAEAYKKERADYGTFMHGAFEELIINRMYDLDMLNDKLLQYIERKKLPENFIYYADDLKKDVLAFAQFVIDYDVKPLAVEISLVHPTLGYAGMIDLPCTMKKSPKSTERIAAIVDFKSGRKGFYEEHELQLHLYKDMWNANFPDMQIDKVFNFSPKDWRKTPTYNLKDQTDSPNVSKIPHLLAIAGVEDDKRDNVFTSVTGAVMLDSNTDLTANIVSMTLAELVSKRRNNDDKVKEEESQEEEKEDKGEIKRSKASSNEECINLHSSEENAANAKFQQNNLFDDIEV